jgi:hypothetical protein
MKKLLIFAAVGEALTGLALLVYAPIVVRLMLSAEITGAGIVMSRLVGISLIALGIACWPGNMAHRALYGMLTYSTLTTLLMIYAGISGMVGILLWPAAVVHAGLSILLVRAWRKEQMPRQHKNLNG